MLLHGIMAVARPEPMVVAAVRGSVVAVMVVLVMLVLRLAAFRGVGRRARAGDTQAHVESRACQHTIVATRQTAIDLRRRLSDAFQDRSFIVGEGAQQRRNEHIACRPAQGVQVNLHA
jgi:hypothetical protein